MAIVALSKFIDDISLIQTASHREDAGFLIPDVVLKQPRMRPFNAPVVACWLAPPSGTGPTRRMFQVEERSQLR